MTSLLATALLILPCAARAQGFDVPVIEEKESTRSPVDPDETIRAGFSLEAAGADPIVGQVLPGSPAEELGLASGDSLWYFNGERIASRADAAAALASWTPGTRLSAVVGRAHRIVPLASEPPEQEAQGERSSQSLTLSEKRLRFAILKAAAKRPIAKLQAPAFPIEKGDTVWIRFPKGLPRSLDRGMILKAETAASLTTDESLDFAAIPQGSRIWTQVVSENTAGRLRWIRLYAYKLRLEGGRSYAISAMIDEVSGERSLLRAGPDGTIAAALNPKDEWMAEPSRRFRLRFLKPFAITEPPSFYRAGPGLWFKSVGAGKKKAFEITHIIPDRSAQQAGLAVGDRIFRIGGAWAIKLDFSSALGKLYGPPGTKLKLRVVRKMGLKLERVTLLRGVRYEKNSKEPISLPPPIRSSVLIR